MKTFELSRKFRKMDAEQQTSLIVGMYREYIMKAHRRLEILADFTWRDVTLDPGKRLVLSAPTSGKLFSEQERDNNLIDFAGVIYCLATGETSSESMGWDAGRRIEAPVLREIVLTICGRNEEAGPLLERLERGYVDADDFFDGYTTVDELDGIRELWRRRRVEEAQRYSERSDNHILAMKALYPHWTERWGWKLLGAVVAVNVLLMLCLWIFGG